MLELNRHYILAESAVMTKLKQNAQIKAALVIGDVVQSELVPIAVPPGVAGAEQPADRPEDEPQVQLSRVTLE